MTGTAPPVVPLSAPPRDVALTAGVSTLAMAVAGGFAAVSVTNLAGDGAAGTVDRITGAGPLLGLAITAFLVVAVLDVVLAWALWRWFGSSRGELAALAGWLRVTYTATLVAAVGHLVTALAVARDGGTDDAAQAALGQFTSTWQLGLVVFAAHLVVLGTLVVRDAGTPAWLGAIILVAGFAYAADGVARLFVADGAALLTVLTGLVSVTSVVGEVGLGVWFLIRGGKNR
ncbi:DUF4386 domain-containing protein [Myceligenerans crystallogenes]|uniref:DUF4386 domain-containing protein n=1 Tax=Myceligenerans crystallogenes TaxID=316335 RepID=A0ABN2NC38_9MICO